MEGEGYSRDLLCGIGRGDAPPREEMLRLPGVEMEEVELRLGLSLGGGFGLERRGEKLDRSSSVTAVFMTPAEVVPPPALARTSSLPVKADVGRKQGLNGCGSCCENGGLGVEATARSSTARLPLSGSPSSASSDGEGQRLQDTLLRASSLPAGIEAASTEDKWRKRKAAQGLKRLEVKKRIERRNSLTCNISKEATGQVLEEMNAITDKRESRDEVVRNNSNDKHLIKGIPPKHQTSITSEDCSLLTMRKKPNSTFKDGSGSEEHRPSSAVTPPGEAANSATLPSSPLCSPFPSPAIRAPAIGSKGDQETISSRAAERAKSMGDAERIMMQEMPCVSTKGLPNGNRVEGFLYKYRKGEEVRIVCVCHGSFLTPAEFVKHAGGDNVANPLKHIVVNPAPQACL